MFPSIDGERCFTVGDKVVNLNDVVGEIVETVLIDGWYPLHSLKYADGKIGIPVWENHELKEAT